MSQVGKLTSLWSSDVEYDREKNMLFNLTDQSFAQCLVCIKSEQLLPARPPWNHEFLFIFNIGQAKTDLPTWNWPDRGLKYSLSSLVSNSEWSLFFFFESQPTPFVYELGLLICERLESFLTLKTQNKHAVLHHEALPFSSLSFWLL